MVYFRVLVCFAALMCGSLAVGAQVVGVELAHFETGTEAVAALPMPALPAVAALPAPPEPAVRPSGSGGDVITLVVVGDVGLNASGETVRRDGAVRHGAVVAWTELTREIAPRLNGDLNFANLETVVTERNDLRLVEKAYNFRSHPAGVRHLVDAGLNLFSTANNHAGDFGNAGVRDTIHHLEALAPYGLRAHAGVGSDRNAAMTPKAVAIKGRRLLLSALGIGAGGIGLARAGRDQAGQMSYGAAEDFADTVQALGAADGAYRMLSVHYGQELQVRPASEDVRRLRDVAVRAGNADLVIGHHAHVAAGVQEVGGRFVLYGLGNFMHPGMQDMAKFGICRDFGLMLRLHLADSGSGRLTALAIEALPLTGMHGTVRVMTPVEAGRRVAVLNAHADGLDDAAAGAAGVRFSVRADGTGLYCAAGAAGHDSPMGRMCQGHAAPEPPAAKLAREIASSCGIDRMAQRRVPPVDAVNATGHAAAARSSRRAAGLAAGLVQSDAVSTPAPAFLADARFDR